MTRDRGGGRLPDVAGLLTGTNASYYIRSRLVRTYKEACGAFRSGRQELTLILSVLHLESMEQTGSRFSFRFVGAIPRAGAIVSSYLTDAAACLQNGHFSLFIPGI